MSNKIQQHISRPRLVLTFYLASNSPWRRSTVSEASLIQSYLDSMLTSISEVFSIPTSQYIRHELTVWLPYFIKRHILRRKIAKPPPIIEKAEHAEKIDSY